MAVRKVEYIIRLRDRFSKGIDRVNAKAFQLNNRMNQLNKTTSGLGTVLGRVFTGVAIAQIIKFGAGFEESLTKIETLVGISKDKVEGFERVIKKLSATTGRSANELAKALFTVTSAGLRGAKATEVLEFAAKASAVGLGETEVVAKALTGILQSYSRQGLTAARATDILTSVIREGNLEASSLAPVLGRVTGIASELGISFEEVGASIATFTRLGVSAEQAVTGLRGILNVLIKETPQSQKALESVGLSFEGLRKSIKEKGLTRTLISLVGRFKDNTSALGEVIPNVRALSAVLGTAGAQAESYGEIIENITRSQGILDEAFKTTTETAAFKMTRAFGFAKTVLADLGKVGLQELVPAFELMTTIMKALSSSIEPIIKITKIAIITFITYKATVFLLTKGLKLYVIITKAVIIVTRLLTGGLKAARTAMIAFGIATKASPIGVIAGLLATAAGAFLLFKDDVDEATSSLDKFGNKLDEISAKRGAFLFAESVRGFVDPITKIIKTGSIQKLTEAAVNFNKGQLESLRLFFEEQEELLGRAIINAKTALEKTVLEQDLEDILNAMRVVNKEFAKFAKGKAAIGGLTTGGISVKQVGVTKIVSAAPKIFNINIEKLVETINNNVTNIKEGMNESKKIITEALLSALNDTQAIVR